MGKFITVKLRKNKVFVKEFNFYNLIWENLNKILKNNKKSLKVIL